MSNLQTALHKVGYRPRKIKPRPTLEQLVDGVMEPLTKVRPDRRIQVQRAGGFYTARFEGRKNFVFGACASTAVERLKVASVANRDY